MALRLALAFFRCPILPCPWWIALMAVVTFGAGYLVGLKAGKAKQ